MTQGEAPTKGKAIDETCNISRNTFLCKDNGF